MSWPVDMPLVTVTVGTYRLTSTGAPVNVRVTLTPSVKALTWNGDTIACDPIVLQTKNGEGSVQVPPTDHQDIVPSGWYYTVKEELGPTHLRKPWQFQPVSTDTVVDLDTVAPAQVSAGGVQLAQGPPGSPGPPGKDGSAWGATLSGGMEDGQPFIRIDSSPWGVDSEGNPYWDENGAPSAERAVPVFNADGSVSLVIPTGVFPSV